MVWPVDRIRKQNTHLEKIWTMTKWYTVRSDVEERVAEERLAWNDKNVPAWPKNISVLRILGPLKICSAGD